MITVMAASAFLTSLPFAAFEVARETVIWPDTRGWIVAAFTAIFPSLVAQVMFIKGNEIIGSNRAGIFINLVPIFGTLLSRDDFGRDAAVLSRRGAGPGAGRDLAVGAGEAVSRQLRLETAALHGCFAPPSRIDTAGVGYRKVSVHEDSLFRLATTKSGLPGSFRACKR
jgi:hypothetical protein